MPSSSASASPPRTRPKFCQTPPLPRRLTLQTADSSHRYTRTRRNLQQRPPHRGLFAAGDIPWTPGLPGKRKSMGTLLESINFPADVKRLNPAQLAELAEEIREFLIQTLSKTSGARSFCPGSRFFSFPCQVFHAFSRQSPLGGVGARFFFDSTYSLVFSPFGGLSLPDRRRQAPVGAKEG